jgi:hypothetical protein
LLHESQNKGRRKKGKKKKKKKKEGYHSHVGSMTLTHVAFGERAQRDNSVFAKKKNMEEAARVNLILVVLPGQPSF